MHLSSSYCPYLSHPVVKPLFIYEVSPICIFVAFYKLGDVLIYRPDHLVFFLELDKMSATVLFMLSPEIVVFLLQSGHTVIIVEIVDYPKGKEDKFDP